jgi:hypothetical protein
MPLTASPPSTILQMVPLPTPGRIDHPFAPGFAS